MVALTTNIVSAPVGAASGLNGTSVAGSIRSLNGAVIFAVVEKPSNVFNAATSGLVIFSGTESVCPGRL